MFVCFLLNMIYQISSFLGVLWSVCYFFKRKRGKYIYYFFYKNGGIGSPLPSPPKSVPALTQILYEITLSSSMNDSIIYPFIYFNQSNLFSLSLLHQNQHCLVTQSSSLPLLLSKFLDLCSFIGSKSMREKKKKW